MTTSRPWRDAERRQGVDVLGRLRHPALVGGDDEQHRRDRADAGEHRGDEPFVPRDVDERDLRARGQRRPGEPEVDRHAAAALLGPPVGLHPGERPDQRRLAVVDVPGRGYDLHALRSHGGGQRVVGVRRAARAGRAGSGPGRAGPAPPARRRAARPRTARAGRRAALGSATPGAPPPPTVASEPTASASTPWRRRASASRVGAGVQRGGRRRRGPAGRVWPGRAGWPPSRRASACRRAAPGPAGAGAGGRPARRPRRGRRAAARPAGRRGACRPTR